MADRSADSDGIVDVDAIDYRPWTDLAAAARLMCAHWPSPRWAYDEALLAEYLDRPDSDRSLHVGAFADGKPVGFVAGIPMRVECDGLCHDALFASFFTADPSAPLGVPIRLLRTLADAALAAGFSHYVTVVEAQGRTEALVPALHARAGVALRIERKIHAWIGAPSALVGVADSGLQVREARPADAEELVGALESMPSVGLRQVPRAAVIGGWLERSNWCRVVERDGEMIAFALARRRVVVDAHRARTNVQVDWIANWGGDRAAGPTVAAVVGDLARQAQAQSVDLLVIQDGGGLPTVAECCPGLLRAPHAMQLFTATLDGADSMPAIATAALEVF